MASKKKKTRKATTKVEWQPLRFEELAPSVQLDVRHWRTRRQSLTGREYTLEETMCWLLDLPDPAKEARVQELEGRFQTEVLAIARDSDTAQLAVDAAKRLLTGLREIDQPWRV